MWKGPDEGGDLGLQFGVAVLGTTSGEFKDVR
jgi:hypothetical protein